MKGCDFKVIWSKIKGHRSQVSICVILYLANVCVIREVIFSANYLYRFSHPFSNYRQSNSNNDYFNFVPRRLETAIATFDLVIYHSN